MNKVEYMEVTLPNNTYIFNFERAFDPVDTKQWMIKNWTNGFYYCGIYMILIFGGQHYMSNRPRFELKGLLTIWNTMLATFSIIGFTRTAPELIYAFRHYGFHYSICVPSFILHNRVSGFWTWMFVLSKLPELGDTIFIVLRKQRLIFLHWYHHITVLLYAWFSYTEYASTARWYVVMNYFVHSIMYSYYALKAMRYRPPKSIAMVITTLQLLQMVMGVIVNISAFQYLEGGKADCHISRINVTLGLLIYFSYFILFAKFFQKSYLNSRPDTKVAKKSYINGTEYEKLKGN